MEIRCCYRLTLHGEVIHTIFDTEKRVIIGLPENFFNAEKLNLPGYSEYNYKNTDTQFDIMVEAVLLADKDYCICVELCNFGYYVVTWSGGIKFLHSPMEEQEDFRQTAIPHSENFKSIGYRNTKLRQVRSFDGIYRLTLNKSTGLIHTQDGILKPEFDINNLDDLSYSYAGYKDMINKGYYAIIYKNGKPVFLEKTDDNKLIIKED